MCLAMISALPRVVWGLVINFVTTDTSTCASPLALSRKI